MTRKKQNKRTLAEKRQEHHTTADKPANPSFHNFTVRRTIEIHLTTINPQLTQRDAEFYVDGTSTLGDNWTESIRTSISHA